MANLLTNFMKKYFQKKAMGGEEWKKSVVNIWYHKETFPTNLRDYIQTSLSFFVKARREDNDK